MAESVTVARPYAQAVFNLAKEKGALPVWSDRLHRLALIASDPEMTRVIGNPKFSARQTADLFRTLSGEPADRELAAFIDLLAENERFDVLSEISAIFESLKSDDEGIKTAEIASAFPIDASELSVLMRELETHFGQRLEGKVSVDPALIGGVRVTIGDRVFDASVRGKLDLMAVALKN